MKETEFKCPICGQPMTTIAGTQLDEKDGITMVCLNPDRAACYPHENVQGHGKNEKDAYEAACEKFKKVQE